MPRKLMRIMLSRFTIRCPHHGRAMKTIFFFVFVALMANIAWSDEEIIVDPRGSPHSFPHFWERMFGSGRAILTLRDSYRQDLRLVKATTDFKYGPLHAILHTQVAI